MSIEDTRQEIAELIDDDEGVVAAVWTNAAGTQTTVNVVPMPATVEYNYGDGGTRAIRTMEVYMSNSQADGAVPQVNETLTVDSDVYKILRSRNSIGFVFLALERVGRMKEVHENQIRKL